MKDVLKSPAKIVFIIIAITASIGFFLGILNEDNFMVLAMAVFTFFCAYKGKENVEYAGK